MYVDYLYKDKLRVTKPYEKLLREEAAKQGETIATIRSDVDWFDAFLAGRSIEELIEIAEIFDLPDEEIQALREFLNDEDEGLDAPCATPTLSITNAQPLVVFAYPKLAEGISI